MKRYLSRAADLYSESDAGTVGVLSVLLAVFVAETLLLLGLSAAGLVVHGLTILGTLVAIDSSDRRHQSIYQALLLLPLVRLFGAGVPRVVGNDFAFLGLSYAVLLLSAGLVARSQSLSPEGIGLCRRNLRSVGPGLLVGALFGVVGYALPISSFEFTLTPLQYSLVVGVLGLFVGFVEELVLRGLLQYRLVEVLDERIVVLGIGLLVGLMYGTWTTSAQAVLASGLALLTGSLFARTRDLVLVTAVRSGSVTASLVVLPLLYG
jgi:membrane protease YdiL (CAAX protease family)